jgi:hypothetical protein
VGDRGTETVAALISAREKFGRFMKREAERLMQLMKAGIVGKL